MRQKRSLVALGGERVLGMARLAAREVCWQRLGYLALVWAFAMFSPKSARAQQQITTDHFFIYYQKSTEGTARQVADVADEAYEQLADIFKFYEDHPKVHVIVRDDMDFGNGWTNYFQNVITIWATNLDSELRGKQNWVKNVLVHELTHLISLNIASKGPINLGLVQIGRHNEEVDFSLTLPAYHLVVPEWFSEGVAQYEDEVVGAESWDTHRDMLLRMATLEDDLLSYNQMGVFSHDGLHSEMVYNQGYALTRYIAQQHGPGKVEELVRNIGLLNFDSSIKRVLGMTPRKLYRDWRNQIEQTYQAHVAGAGDVVEGKKLADDGFLEYYPTYSPDGSKLAYLSSEDRDYAITKIRIRDLSTGKTRTLDKKVYSRFSWTPDGKKLVYARLGEKTLYFDLYVYDLQADREERISAGLRAKDPAVSPDGQHIAFVSNKDGSNNIGLANIDGSDVRYLSHNQHGIQYYAPQWSPDGERIAFGVYQGQDRDIAMVNASCTPYSKKLASADSSAFPDSVAFAADADFTVIVNNPADERDACWLPDGEGIVFCSDRGGSFNLYETRLDNGETKQVSNVLGGVFAPSVSPDGEQIAYVGYHAADHSIYALKRGAYQKPQDWEASDRDYLTLAKDEPLEDAFSVGHYTRKYSLSGIYPIISLGPAFIGEKVGLETLNGGIQLGVGDVLGANQLVTAFSLGRNLKKKMDWNTELELFYARRLRSVFTQHSVLTPTAYVYCNKLRLNDLDEEHAAQDTLYEYTVNGTPVSEDIDWEFHSSQEARYDYARLVCGLQFPLGRRQQVAVEYGYRKYWESFDSEIATSDSSRFFMGSVDVTDDFKLLYPYLVTQQGYFIAIDTTLTYKYRIRELNYFTSHDVALYWSYVKVKPTRDSQIHPRGGRQINVALRRTASIVTDSITFLDSEGITTEYKKDVEDVALYEAIASWREYIGMPLGKDALTLWLLAAYKNRPVRTKREGGDFYWPLRYYLGGQGTLRGYPYFALSGSKVLFARATYRFPIFQHIDRQWLHCYFDKLYGAVFAEAGTAWNSERIKDISAGDFLRDVGAELNLQLFTFYRIPLVGYLQVVKPLDKSQLRDRLVADGWSAEDVDSMVRATYEPKYYFGLRFR